MKDRNADKFREVVITTVLVLLGGIGGFLYYRIWGCSTGCTIASSLTATVLYGSAVGFLLSSIVAEIVKPRKNNKLNRAEKQKE